jgi:hypothetical protein
MSELQEKQLIKTIVCPAKVSDFNPKLGATTLDYKASIAAAKGAVTKLTKNLTGYAPFFIVNDFFKNPTTNKPIGPVFVLGKEKKVAKHFVSVEMKSGKVDQRSSATQKDAATGRIYAEQTETGLMLCFEPHPKCKVPAPKWEKLFKALKPCLKGLKCKVVEPSAAAIAEAAAEEQAAGGATTETANPAAAQTAGFDETSMSNLALAIKQDLQATSELVAKLKSGGTPTDADKNLVQLLRNNITSFKDMYPSAPTATQTKFQTFYTQATQQEPNLAQLSQKLGIAGPASQASDLDIDALLKMADDAITDTQKIQPTLFSELEAGETITIPSGEAFFGIIDA